MNYKLITIGKTWKVIALLFLTACSNGQNSDSIKNNTEANQQDIPEFEIIFPETEFKVETTTTTEPSVGNILVTNQIVQGADSNGPFMYFIAYNEVPQNIKEITNGDPELLNTALRAMLVGSAEKLGGNDFEFKNIKYKNYIGVESICKVFDGDGIIKSRVYKIENYLFVASAGGRKISLESVDKFLNSFRLKN